MAVSGIGAESYCRWTGSGVGVCSHEQANWSALLRHADDASGEAVGVMNARQRTRIATGIYRDGIGLRDDGEGRHRAGGTAQDSRYVARRRVRDEGADAAGGNHRIHWRPVCGTEAGGAGGRGTRAQGVDRADRKGGEPRAFWLNADRVGAWEAFMYAAAWPKDVRPYQARHSIALDLRARGIDHLADVAAVLGHRQIATTRKHNAPVLVSRLK
jgi:hypothetical protein